ncbi:MAG: MBL fold metallo-hydrolase [Armatimonadota bacterium]
MQSPPPEECPEMMKPQQIAPNIYMYTDSCNCYALVSGENALLIDPGEGGIIDHLKTLGVKRVDWVLHTHAHRELAGADRRLIGRGAKIAVPERSRPFFEQAEELWQKRHTYFTFAYAEKYALPLRNISVSSELTGGGRFLWNEYELQILSTPGHSEFGVSLILNHGSQRIGFTGDVMAAPGKLWEFDSLQTGYEEFIQGPELVRVPELQASLKALAKQEITLMLPAHGEPMKSPNIGMRLLDRQLTRLVENAKETRYYDGGFDPVPEVIAIGTCAIQYFIPDGKGNCVMVDAGFYDWDSGRINLFEKMKEHPEIKNIEIVIPTHIHSDHVALCRAMRHRYGAKVYAHECQADVLARPERYFVPCLCNQPITVDRVFKEGESFTWSGMKFSMYHFPGHTYWHQLTVLEVNGKKIAFTGDAIDDFDHVRSIDTFNYNPIGDHVGANRCVDLLEQINPDYLCTGHWSIHKWKPEYVKGMRDWVSRHNRLITQMSAQADPNLSYHIHWADLLPFRSVLQPGEKRKLSVKLLNHLPTVGQFDVKLELPEGWSAKPALAHLSLPAKGSAELPFEVTAPRQAKPMRYMAGVNVVLNGQAYGAMGLGCLDIGEDWSIENRDPSQVPGVSQPDYGFQASS